MVGADLNRVWNDYSEYFHPTVKAAMDAIRHLDEQPVCLVNIYKIYSILLYIFIN
jgi:hypothetical protein